MISKVNEQELKKQKFDSLISNTEFVGELLTKETAEDARQKFAEEGVDLSLNEVQIVGTMINKAICGDKSELSKEELENIAGGAEERGESFSKGFFGEIGKSCAVLAMLPIVVGASKLVGWGVDKLIKRIDGKSKK